MGNDLPYVPFDPQKIGPFELVGQQWNRAKAFCTDNAPWVIVGVLVLAVSWWHFELSLPEIPNWFWVAVLGVLVANLVAWPVSKKIAAALHDPSYVRLSEQNAVTGDQRIMLIAPDRFQEMVVRNQNDREVSRDYLHEVLINGKKCYEVDRYHAEENVAIASWQAGVSNSEIRRDRSQISKIKQDLEEESNKALEALANNPDAVRQVGAEVANDIIRTAEKVENPDGGALHKRMTEILDDVDDTDELIADNSNDVESGIETSDGTDPDGDGTQSVTIQVNDE